MIAYLVYVGGFLAMAVVLLLAIHLAVTAEDRSYTGVLPGAPVEKESPAPVPTERAA